MTQYVQVLVARPMTPTKLESALADMRTHGMPDHADLSTRDLHDGLELRAHW